jgi:transposase-like protein
MSGKKGMKPYPKEVKLEAIHLFYEGGLTRREIEEKLGLSKGRVKAWLRIYRREGEAGLQKPRRGRPPKRENTEAYIRRLEMENDLLKKLHAELRRERLAKRNIGSSTKIEKDTK